MVTEAPAANAVDVSITKHGLPYVEAFGESVLAVTPSGLSQQVAKAYNTVLQGDLRGLEPFSVPRSTGLETVISAAGNFWSGMTTSASTEADIAGKLKVKAYAQTL